MSKVSFLIPSRSEPFLVPTVNGIFDNCSPGTEVVVCLDGGPWPDPPLPVRDNLIVIRHAESQGTRAAINACATAATGDYFCKLDAHCLLAPGFDKAMIAACFPNHVVVPRRKRLDAANWKIEETSRPDIDYEYMSYHPTDFGGRGHNITRWEERNRDESLKSILTDDLMAFQASCYFTRRDYWEYLELMDEATYGKTQNEGEEVALKAWLSGGRVIIEKRTWFAHLWKGSRYPRDYKFESSDLEAGASGVRRWLTDSAWHRQSLPFSWLIDKFNPPGWPADWADKADKGISFGRSFAPLPEILQQQIAGRVTQSITAPFTTMEDLKDESLPLPSEPDVPATFERTTLQRILAKFNLDPNGDYSKLSMPIGLRINRRQLAELLCKLGFRVGAEVGTAEGKYAEVLCKANPEMLLYCVDPWQSYSGYRDYKVQATLNDLYSQARKRLKGCNVKFVQKFSVDAAKDFEDGNLDFAFIDGNHAYEYVVADIAAWLPKLRSGGVLFGHDYSHPRDKQFGVVEAVQGWTSAYKIAPWFICKGENEAVGDRTHCWMFVKS